MIHRPELYDRSMSRLRKLPYPAMIDERYLRRKFFWWSAITVVLYLWLPSIFKSVGGWYLPLVALGCRLVYTVIVKELDARSRFGAFPYRFRVEMAMYLLQTREYMDICLNYLADLRFNNVELPGITERIQNLRRDAEETFNDLVKLRTLPDAAVPPS